MEFGGHCQVTTFHFHITQDGGVGFCRRAVCRHFDVAIHSAIELQRQIGAGVCTRCADVDIVDQAGCAVDDQVGVCIGAECSDRNHGTGQHHITRNVGAGIGRQAIGRHADIAFNVAIEFQRHIGAGIVCVSRDCDVVDETTGVANVQVRIAAHAAGGHGQVDGFTLVTQSGEVFKLSVDVCRSSGQQFACSDADVTSD